MNDNDPYDNEDAGDEEEWFSEPVDDGGQPSQLPPEHGIAPQRTPPRTQYGPPSYATIRCHNCGYNLTGIAIGSDCPECGTPLAESLYSNAAAPPNGFAITSLVLGICAVCGLCCCYGGFLGLPGLIFGIVAMSQMKTGQYNNASNGMAIAGMICSGVALALVVVTIFLAIVS
ncbi:MAG: DUF4190 domain-containing protein [Planctomycetota bacterium]